jgi:FKBP-type peptidyl-prolyl cis-trans isomerase (trigger factor)
MHITARLCFPQMADDAQAPATKEDIRLLMEQIGTYYSQTQQQIEAYYSQTQVQIAEMEERMMRHFDVTVETIRHDLLGANKDKIESHEDRLGRLERHTGLLAA